MFGIGFGELLIILIIVLLIFGAKRLPQLARSLGLAVKEFKRGMNEEGDQGGTERSFEEKQATSEPGSPRTETKDSSDEKHQTNEDTK